jgi:hypothetical protein
LQAAGVDGAIKAVAGQGFGDQLSYGFHLGLLEFGAAGATAPDHFCF